MKKAHLPTKLCAVCKLPFTWRKKWEKNWDEVRCLRQRSGTVQRTMQTKQTS